jgi:hypothetical protein
MRTEFVQLRGRSRGGGIARFYRGLSSDWQRGRGADTAGRLRDQKKRWRNLTLRKPFSHEEERPQYRRHLKHVSRTLANAQDSVLSTTPDGCNSVPERTRVSAKDVHGCTQTYIARRSEGIQYGAMMYMRVRTDIARNGRSPGNEPNVPRPEERTPSRRRGAMYMRSRDDFGPDDSHTGDQRA